MRPQILDIFGSVIDNTEMCCADPVRNAIVVVNLLDHGQRMKDEQ